MHMYFYLTIGITVTLKQNSRSIIFITEYSTVAFKFPKVERPDTSAFEVESKIKLESYPHQNLKEKVFHHIHRLVDVKPVTSNQNRITRKK